MSLLQSLTHFQTIFALICYCLGLVIALPIFEHLHEKLEHHSLQYFWDKIGMPILRACLLMFFVYLAYPLSFGMEQAPGWPEIISNNDARMNLLFNIIFLVTFVYPILPIIGKADALMIPLQGMIASMIVFNWLAEYTGLKDYSLLPGIDTFVVIIIFGSATFFLAKSIAKVIGNWLDNILHREGYEILVFHAVIMIMQTPIIYLYGHSLGKQIVSMP